MLFTIYFFNVNMHVKVNIPVFNVVSIIHNNLF